MNEQTKLVPIVSSRFELNGDDPDTRCKRAIEAIKDILTKEGCVIAVESLDISTGTILPKISVKVKE
jgi:hypothetical protein